MDNCIVCCKTNEDIFSRITTVSSEWKEWNIQRIIEKHLWWWYLRPASPNGVEQWLCRQCWQKLLTFHNFYITVEKEQRLFEKFLISQIKCDSDNNVVAAAAVDIKVEEQHIKNDSLIDKETLLHLERPKRGRKRKTVYTTENIQMEELNIVEVKYDCDNMNAMAVDIKVEDQNNKNVSLIGKETVLNLERPKRGRKRKTFNVTENIQIEELNIEVKNENITSENLDDPILENNCWQNSSVEEQQTEDSMSDDNSFPNSIVEEYQPEMEDFENDSKQNILLSKKPTQKCLPAANDVKKSRKKYRKTNGEKKTKVAKIPTKSWTKNDEFLAANNFVLSCDICNDELDTFNNLQIHFREKHETVAYVICCNKKFYRRDNLVDHLNVHKDPNYFKCPKCNKCVTTRYSYKKHLETHELYETQQNFFKCDKCDKTFLKKSVLAKHILLHVPEEERNFPCSMCAKKFASEYLRKQHFEYMHSKKYDKVCDICGVSMRNKLYFNRHMAKHNGETATKFKCDICGVEITNKYFLNRHIKLMHTVQAEQICPYCSKISPNSMAHKNHIKYAHTMERKHACHMCDKKFRRPYELKEHLSTHTGEPLYSCPCCPLTFISSANMYKHIRLKHEKEWEKRRMKREEKTLASKVFLESVESQSRETYNEEISVMETESREAVNNLEELSF